LVQAAGEGLVPHPELKTTLVRHRSDVGRIGRELRFREKNALEMRTQDADTRVLSRGDVLPIDFSGRSQPSPFH
jgi:hypothetical protein